MKHPPERDWMIVAPWWHWTAPGTVPPGQPVVPDLQKGLLSRPVFQKYDSPRLVNDFLADPQRSLKFIAEDLVHAVRKMPPVPTGSGGTLHRLSEEEYVPDGTDTRKIFLSTHKRFYLVACGIHCDGPGFPKAARGKVCQAGFVIRRRTTDPPVSGVAEVKPILKSLQMGRARLTRVSELAEIESIALAAATGQDDLPHSPKLESLLKTRASLQALVASEKARFDDWVKRFGVVPQLQGWFPSPQGFDKVGSWQPVGEIPGELGLEASFPLYPLIPSKNEPTHAGQYGTIYFGVLPTSSRDCDCSGRPRFDDQGYYEVCCWVKRHLVPHDPDEPCRCPDGIFWSVPTRPYKLAAHFDLTGTGHHPVIIPVPDLKTLAAQARPSFGVGLAKPPGSLMPSVDEDGNLKKKLGRSDKVEICFIPIPLITIVVTFVFELFLPVIMFLFQLWWMLALKFCIPPEVELDAGINAELGISGGLGFAIDANVQINAALEGKLGNLLHLEERFGVDAKTALEKMYSPIALANLELQVNGAADPTRPGSPSVTAGLDFEVGVTHA
jgi:hypothetical protein